MVLDAWNYTNVRFATSVTSDLHVTTANLKNCWKQDGAGAESGQTVLFFVAELWDLTRVTF